MTPFSILDLAPVARGDSPAGAFRNSLDLARHAERWGYRRYWLAEHHNMPGIASAATAVVIGFIAAGTSTIRVGAGGVMLPNHAPLVIAEQFGTLESMYPGRIDLGLGRAPGTDARTSQALRRTIASVDDSFPRDVVELLSYFEAAQPGQTVRAVPGSGLNVPVWLLGSSLFSAELAAHLGLPFAFASHFAPDYLLPALDIYRSAFRPSNALPAPYAMVGVGVYVADTDADARRLFTSVQQQFVNLRRGMPGLLQPPLEIRTPDLPIRTPDLKVGPTVGPTTDAPWSAEEQAGVDHALRYSAVGSPATVRERLTAFIDLTKADEVIAAAQIFDHRARLRSYELLADIVHTPGA